MGTYRQSVILVAAYEPSDLDDAHLKAEEVFADAQGYFITLTQTLGGKAQFAILGPSFKTGRAGAEESEKSRRQYVTWLTEHDHYDSLDWAEVEWGEDCRAVVLADGEDHDSIGPVCRICHSVRAEGHTDVCRGCWTENEWCRTGTTYGESGPAVG